jgi:hypothetical protein
MSKLVEHLLGRHMDLSLHRPMLDEEAGVATFWLYTLTGQVAGYHAYKMGAPKLKAENVKGVSNE